MALWRLHWWSSSNIRIHNTEKRTKVPSRFCHLRKHQRVWDKTDTIDTNYNGSSLRLRLQDYLVGFLSIYAAFLLYIKDVLHEALSEFFYFIYQPGQMYFRKILNQGFPPSSPMYLLYWPVMLSPRNCFRQISTCCNLVAYKMVAVSLFKMQRHQQ